ncbi:RDD family protein [Bremerella alba]|uniref:RDD domain-containing protein n=1 Tax=Bremerella alba TaxID=980252 RepID=A0A7V8VA62_9BACT|nr:RDD family protein [Bremerella alba]MBA2117736.1 hypothetical protein [Bremerella alba]
MSDNSLGEADFYDPSDYIGIGRRLLVYLIDSFVMIVVGVPLWILVTTLWKFDLLQMDDPNIPFWTIYLISIWVYLVPIKRSRFGTLGFWLLGINIVSAQGGPPSLLVMTGRMLMWILGPFNFFLDLFWLGLDSERQTLRDCFMGTYLIKRDAKAIGRAPVHLTRYNAMGFALTYPRVCRPNAAGK